jgi:hypothetical protein
MSEPIDLSGFGEHIFREFRGSDNLKNLRQSRLQRLESRFVKKIIKFYFSDKYNFIIKHLMSEYKQKTGLDGLRFSSFYDKFKDFPIWLGSELVPSLIKESLSDFLSPKLFKKSGLFRAWTRFCDCLPGFILDSDIPLGFVFDFYHSKAGCGVLWIFHNNPNVSNDFIRLRADGQLFYIQPFSLFLEGLKWSKKI